MMQLSIKDIVEEFGKFRSGEEDVFNLFGYSFLYSIDKNDRL